MPATPSDPGVPLSRYRGEADVLLFCRGCGTSTTVELEAVIARLNARGLDGEAVGIIELARLTTQACGHCGARAWETRPAFPTIEGSMGL